MQVAKPKKGYKLVKTSFGKYEEIPEEWKVKSLGDVSDVFGGMPAPKDDAIFDQGTIPFVRMQDLGRYHETNNLEITRDKLNSRQVKEKKFNIIKKGAILMPRSGSVALNHRAILGNDSCIVSHICALVVKKDIMNNEFLYHHLCTVDMKKIGSKTTGLDAITFEDLKKLKIFSPNNVPEQKQIASILSNVYDTLQKTNQIIDQTQRLKKGMIQKLLTRGIGHTKFKKVKWYFGKQIEIPEKWEISSLKEISENGLQNGIFKKKSEFGYGIPLINVFDLYTETDINTNNLEKVKVTDKELQKYQVRVGDIFFDRSSLVLEGIGHSNIILKKSEPVVFECHVMKLSPKDIIIPEFLLYFTKLSLFRNYIMSIAKVATMTTISQPDLEKAKILIPLRNEQKQIASILSNVDTQIQKEKLHKSNLERLKKGLMQKLLTGQIRVNVR